MPLTMESDVTTPLITLPNWNSASFNIQLTVGKTVGRGMQGQVVESTLDTPAVSHYRCVAKCSLGDDTAAAAHERAIHRLLTDANCRSRDGSVLRSIGEYTKQDADGKKHVYDVMRQCDITLADALPSIRALASRDVPLFHHVVLDFLHAMTNGLAHLERHRVVHHDLKPANIGLLDDVFCIYDLGLAETYEEFSKQKPHIQGTPEYIAPELLANEKKFPLARDVWSIGQIFRQILGQESLFLHVAGHTLSEDLSQQLRAYQQARAGSVGPLDKESYQASLRNRLVRQDKFELVLYGLMDAMCNPLPECRPNVETLRWVHQHLQCLLGWVDPLKCKSFYEQMVVEYASSQLVKRQILNEADIQTGPVVQSAPPPPTGYHPRFFASETIVPTEERTAAFLPIVTAR